MQADRGAQPGVVERPSSLGRAPRPRPCELGDDSSRSTAITDGNRLRLESAEALIIYKAVSVSSFNPTTRVSFLPQIDFRCLTDLHTRHHRQNSESQPPDGLDMPKPRHLINSHEEVVRKLWLVEGLSIPQVARVLRERGVCDAR